MDRPSSRGPELTRDSFDALSLFSGVGGLDLGLRRAGMITRTQVENDKKCVRVLERRFPDAERWNDVATFEPKAGEYDLVHGGFPCQDVSVAGRRAGLGGERSGLFFHFVRIVDAVAPAWVLVENVPGLFSSNKGEDFAVVLGELTGFQPAVPRDGWRSGGLCIGPKRAAAWRVLDSRYFGVAQRRRRVFLVCHRRADRAAAVLLDAESVRRRHKTRRAPGQVVASPLGARAKDRGEHDAIDGVGAYVVEPVSTRAERDAVTVRPTDVAGTINAADQGRTERGTIILARSLQSGGGEDVGASKGTLILAPPTAATLSSGSHPNSNAPSRTREDDDNLLAYALRSSERKDNGSPERGDLTLVVQESANPLTRDDGYQGEDGTGRQPALAVIIKRREGASRDSKGESAGKGPLVSEEIALTLGVVDDQTLFAFDEEQITHPENRSDPRPGDPSPTLARNRVNVVSFEPRIARNGRGRPQETTGALTRAPGSSGRGDSAPVVAIRTGQPNASGSYVDEGGPSYTLDTSSTTAIGVGVSVRRLTPTERERLQGFPDGWTCLEDWPPDRPYSTELCRCPDGPRVAQLGNAVTVPVAEAIGVSMLAVDAIA